MRQPEGPLTATQLEVMDAVWDANGSGLTVAQIWEAIAGRRAIARTTVLTLVQRLAARRWLHREGSRGVAHYTATQPRDQALGMATGEFLETYFQGSASALVQNLLGSGQLRASEVRKLRALLDETSPQRRRRQS